MTPTPEERLYIGLEKTALAAADLLSTVASIPYDVKRLGKGFYARLNRPEPLAGITRKPIKSKSPSETTLLINESTYYSELRNEYVKLSQKFSGISGEYQKYIDSSVQIRDTVAENLVLAKDELAKKLTEKLEFDKSLQSVNAKEERLSNRETDLANIDQLRTNMQAAALRRNNAKSQAEFDMWDAKYKMASDTIISGLAMIAKVQAERLAAVSPAERAKRVALDADIRRLQGNITKWSSGTIAFPVGLADYLLANGHIDIDRRKSLIKIKLPYHEMIELLTDLIEKVNKSRDEADSNIDNCNIQLQEIKDKKYDLKLEQGK